MADDWQPKPARGYRWPRAEAGNTLPLKHGANHRPTVEAKMNEQRPARMAAAPWLTEADAEALQRYERAEAVSVLLLTHVLRLAQTEGVEAVKPYLWGEVHRFMRLAASLGNELGLAPTSRARLERDLTAAKLGQVDLEGLMDEGRRVRLEAGQVEQEEAWMTALPCCAAIEGERRLRTRDHLRVACAICATSFCLDRRDAEAEDWYRHHYGTADSHVRCRRHPLAARDWYCSLGCLDVGRQREVGPREPALWASQVAHTQSTAPDGAGARG